VNLGRNEKVELDEFETYLKIKGYSPKTIKEYLLRLKRIEYWNKTNVVWMLKHYPDYLTYWALRAYAKFINDEGMLQFLKKYTKKTKVYSDVDYVKPEEFVKLVKFFNERDKELAMILKIMFFTGLRIGSVLSLTPNNIDFKDRVIRIKVKGNRIHRIPVHEDFLVELYNYINENLIKSTERIFKKSYDGYLKKLKRWSERICGRKIKMHMFRHGFAVNFLRKTNNPYMVQRALGHTNFKTTMRYLTVSTPEFERKIFKFQEDLFNLENETK